MSRFSGRVTAIVVAFNRADLLRETLRALAGQTRPVDDVVVIDNASSDDSAAVARNTCPSAHVIALKRNTGGAGGFTAGMAYALRHCGPDWIWLMDDDTVPTDTALQSLLQVGHDSGLDPAILASRVVWTDGRDHPMNTPRRRPGTGPAALRAASRQGALPIRSASFVSMLVKAESAAEAGLPIADYFIWNDDFEFSTRVLRHRVGLFVPSSVVVHKTKKFGASDADPGERFFFEVRNKLWLFRHSTGLSIRERALYGGSSIARWGRTLQKSSGRRVLLSAFAQGMGKGLTTVPRANSDSLSGLGGISFDVAAVESHLPRSARTPDEIPGGTAPFSLLLPIYSGDTASRFRAAVMSCIENQSARPDEIVLVIDGPISAELERSVQDVVSGCEVDVTAVRMPVNEGLAAALNVGLRRARHNFVARMDADDISYPDRFAEQLPYLMAGYDVVGAAIREFEVAPDGRGQIRPVETNPTELKRTALLRTPVHHPVVMYRRDVVLAAGGYPIDSRMEDYALFGRLLADGACITNLAKPLLWYRVGAGSYRRRGGLAMLRSEIKLQCDFRRIGFTSTLLMVRNLFIRGGYRLVPQKIRKVAYRALFAVRSGCL